MTGHDAMLAVLSATQEELGKSAYWQQNEVPAELWLKLRDRFISLCVINAGAEQFKQREEQQHGQ